MWYPIYEGNSSVSQLEEEKKGILIESIHDRNRNHNWMEISPINWTFSTVSPNGNSKQED
jgi:hypothetical protein